MKNKVVLFLFLLVLFPFYISVRDIIIDSIPFWFDPARDLLTALDNLKKITLIGPPSGIPGIFYGPYWIWFLSFGLLLSKDPRTVAILVLVLPYFTVFPFLLFRFSRIFGVKIAALLWLLFIFGYKTYTTYIWNPHLAPFFFLIMMYILVFTDLSNRKFKTYLRVILAGVFSGFLVNVHISFGMTMTLGAVLFLIAYSKRLTVVSSFALGIFLSFLPNLLFEIRHGFHQTQAIISTVSTAFFDHATVTGYVGLSKTAIIQEFFGSLGKFLHVPVNVTYLVYLLITLHVIFNRHNYLARLDKLSRKLLNFLTINTLCLLIVYLISKNPVWSYHFLGTEIIILFFLGFILTKFKLLRYLMIVWIIGLFTYNIYLLTLPSEVPLFKVDNLATKKHIVQLIYEDSGKLPFAVFAYSSAIYTYDYDYLFRWFGTDKYPNQLPTDPTYTSNVYLIIPKVDDPIKLDFINYKTPNSKYQTIKEWKINDGTSIVKREKIKPPLTFMLKSKT